ncbi:MAG TPA: tRNA (adenosine(37)-N6)-dimethylallyltransferase MiaA [Bacteroidales bacterium]|nr:tRNA (adenosine(37)-N6)-dimethylallyltransferase MiaA [Bacteroidales bacterium]
MKPKILLIITGPTAVGKTDFAIAIAQMLGTEIISADSRQIYREMMVGTARPTIEQLQKVPHHMVACRSIHEYYNASLYEEEVIALLQKLYAQYDTVILTGGSGLYIDAVCYGIDDLPTIDPQVRQQLSDRLRQEGLAVLQAELKRIDPDYYHSADISNPKRVLKALEVYAMTHRPYSSFLTRTPKKREFEPVFVVLDLPRNELHQRIDNRVDQMVQAGLIEEAKSLYPYRHLNALNTVGYKELFEYFEGKCSLEQAIALIKRNTRRYARRQLTWFRRYDKALWIQPQSPDILVPWLKQAEKN